MKFQQDLNKSASISTKNTMSVNFWVIKYFPFIGFSAGIVMWLVDAAIDVLFIHQDESFGESVFSSEFTEIWMRTLVIIVMTTSSLVVQYFMRKQYNHEKTLLNYQDHLEEIVSERTEELQYLANFDVLTEIYNRRKFNQVFDTEMERSKELNYHLCLAMCDIDHFKNVNDQYGHNEGDQVLKDIANILRHNLRATDTYARWGGEEFIMLMPDTDLTTANIVTDKLRLLINTLTCGDDKQKLSASFGITQYKEDDTISSFVIRADAALYEAKNKGRNRVCVKE